MRRRQETKNVN